MRFTRLRIDGFKSFARPVEIPLQPGLTGLLGHNGNGKSNITEALRWVMGGVSAKAMRADDGMASVIFHGTTTEPPRSWAEVVLTIEDRDRELPAPWTGRTMEVSRRVAKKGMSRRGTAKDEGNQPAISTYRIDGDVVTATEVKALFAFTGSGSGSTALIRQMQIAELIAARASDRRALLEDAAGIAGVDQRRKEAMLRLDAAGRELDRHADLIAEIQCTRTAVAQQAETAERYNALSDEIDTIAACLLVIEIEAAGAKHAELERDAAGRSEELGELETGAAALGAERTAAFSAASAAWKAEGEAKDSIKSAEAALHTVEVELARAVRDADQAEAQAASLTRDVERERTMLAEAGQAAEAARVTLAAIAADAGGTELGAGIATLRCEREAASTRIREARSALEALVTQKAMAESAKQDADRRHAEAKSAFQEAQLLLSRAEGELSAVGEPPTGCRQDAEEIAEAALTAAAHDLSVAKAEEGALRRLVAMADRQNLTITEGLVPTPGYEAALAAALGEDVTAGLDDQAPRYWSERGEEAVAEIATLPEGVPPLSSVVEHPPRLARRLSAAGIVSAADGPRLAASLAPGQVLVSREGHVWRWDGLVAKTVNGAPAAALLEQRGRLRDIGAGLPQLEAAVRDARAARKRAERDRVETERHHAAAAKVRAAAGTLRDKQRILAAAERIAAALPVARTIETEIERLRERASEAEGRRDEIADLLSEAEATERVRQSRLQTATAERDAWTERAEAARSRLATSEAALSEAKDRADKLASLPDELAKTKEKRTAALETAREAHHDLAQAAEAARETLRQADGELAATKATIETVRVRVEAAEAAMMTASAQRDELLVRARSAHGTDDVAALSKAWRDANGVPDTDELPRSGLLTRRVSMLEAEQHALGPVNLAAAAELVRIDERLEALRTHRRDIEEAVGMLHKVTASLEEASRQRVAAAFEVVASNFARIFAFLFDGGEARLELVGEDILDAGLEIMAAPPGRRMTSLSLLSGGEQTLTALALIMAAFQARPAPVCVLDEVDAPLSTVNLDRYCRLLEAAAVQAPDTTFLVVTHNSRTTAAMTSFCAVTMDEPGISIARSTTVGASRGAPNDLIKPAQAKSLGTSVG